jgi:hypothetical protein
MVLSKAEGDCGYRVARGSETGETLYESALERLLPIDADPNAGAAGSRFDCIEDADDRRHDGIRTAENGRIPSQNRSCSEF